MVIDNLKMTCLCSSKIDIDQEESYTYKCFKCNKKYYVCFYHNKVKIYNNDDENGLILNKDLALVRTYLKW